MLAMKKEKKTKSNFHQLIIAGEQSFQPERSSFQWNILTREVTELNGWLAERKRPVAGAGTLKNVELQVWDQ